MAAIVSKMTGILSITDSEFWTKVSWVRMVSEYHAIQQLDNFQSLDYKSSLQIITVMSFFMFANQKEKISYQILGPLIPQRDPWLGPWDEIWKMFLIRF